MCLAALAPLGALMGGGAAAGTAAAATAGSVLAQAGAVIGLGAGIMQGVSAFRTGQMNARLLRQRARTESELAAVQDQRERQRFRQAIRRQAAELVGSGIRLDSPTAVLLGEQAGQELSFGSQAIRSGAEATRQELTAEARIAEAQGRLGLLTGTLSAAGSFLSAAPDIWPGLLGGGA